MRGRPTRTGSKVKPSVKRFSKPYKKSQRPVDQLRSDYQISDTSKRRDIEKDKKILAMKSGKRISKNGNIYYEHRSNRSDKNKRTKL